MLSTSFPGKSYRPITSEEPLEPGEEWRIRLAARPMVAPKRQLPKVAPKVTPQSRERPKIAPKMHRTPDEIAQMDDQQFCAEVVRITGITVLPTRKKGQIVAIYSIETHWMYALRKRAMKKGLYADMPMPRTYDEQVLVNEISNPINNPAYSKLRSGHLTMKEEKEVIQERAEQINAQSRCARPYKYT
jgi:DNA-binding cell septation regulator SpoVG